MEKRYVTTIVKSAITLFLILFVSSSVAYSEVPLSILKCPQGPPPSGVEPQYGGTLTLIYDNGPSNLGAPYKPSRFMDGHLNRYAIENLIGLDPNGNPAPQLATGWEEDPANKTVTFTLRKGVKFHDGTDFNAAAAKWCLDMLRSGPLTTLNTVTAVDALGDYKIRLTLSKWDPLFIYNLSASHAGDMVSPTAAKKLGDEITKHPVGTGPFKFVSLVPKVSLKYERFDDYWQKGLPYLDGINIRFVKDSVVALTSFTKGEAQAFRSISEKDAAAYEKKGYTIASNTIQLQGICGDSKNPDSPWADIRVRRAIAHAIDNDTIVKYVYSDMSIATHQLALPGGTGYDPSIKGYPYDPDKARKLLAEAGYGPKNQLKLKMVYQTGSQRTDLFTMVQDYLGKVGVAFEMEAVNRSANMQLMSAGWKNHLMQYSFDYNAVEVAYSASVAENLAAEKTSWVSVETPAEIEALFQKTTPLTDMAARENNYKLINKLAIDKYCVVVPILGYRGLMAKSPKLHDYGFGDTASREFLPERAWLSK